MKCAPGSKWYDSVMTCCPESDVPCQIGISRVDTNLDVGIPLDDVTGAVTCSGYGYCGGEKPCFDHKLWPDWSPGNYPGEGHISWCSSNDECESCCCGSWAGIVNVCIDSTGTGSGLLNVCM